MNRGLRSRLEAHWWARGGAIWPVWTWPLVPLASLYRLAAAWHRRAGQHEAARWRASNPARTPTVVIGNWVLGGAGKTPTTIALLKHLRRQGWTPGVVSRGYGRDRGAPLLVNATRHDAAQVGDEPLLLAKTVGVPVVVAADRRAARDHLLRQHPEINVVVADDGLQHHRLDRDLQVVVVDERGAGNGWCLPAGPLREPIPPEVPDRTCLVYSSGKATLPLAGHLAERRLSELLSLHDWHTGQSAGAEGGWAALDGRAAHAAAGIAVPQRFFDLLRDQGVHVVQTHPLADHDAWSQAPWPADATDAVITEKDAVKVQTLVERGLLTGSTRIWVARLDLALPDELLACVDSRLAQWRESNT